MVPVSTNNQTGTYWWHSHANVGIFVQQLAIYKLTCAIQGQYVDGLRAPLIIHPPVEKHQYDEEFTVILGDWYHAEHGPLLQHFISVANPGGAEPVPGKSGLFLLLNDV